jgi:hypothetical protein
MGDIAALSKVDGMAAATAALQQRLLALQVMATRKRCIRKS